MRIRERAAGECGAVEAITETAWRVVRAELRALLRNGRNEAGLCAGIGQCVEASAGVGGSVQHGIAAAEVERIGQAAASPGAEKRLNRAPIRAMYRPRSLCRGPRLVRTVPLATISENPRYASLARRFPIEGLLPRAARRSVTIAFN